MATEVADQDKEINLVIRKERGGDILPAVSILPNNDPLDLREVQSQ